MGAESWLVSGGMPVANIDTSDVLLKQLPPLRASDSTFTSLVDEHGVVVSETYLKERQRQLLGIATQANPQIVLIESWPFGRRKLRHELIALMQQLQEQTRCPIIVCSIRDILQRGRKAKRLEETVQHVNRWFDHVLVHADPEFVELNYSFELASEIESKLVYTGFVVRPDMVTRRWAPSAGSSVLVSAGGGAVGLALYECAIESARLAPDEFHWHLLIGRGVSEDVKDRLQQSAPHCVKVEWARADFPQLLQRCAVSVSQSGYNTTMDLLGVGCPAVVVPFDSDGETEQRDRAERLQALGIARMIEASTLNPRTLLASVRERSDKVPSRWRANFDGADTTAKWLLDAVKSRA